MSNIESYINLLKANKNLVLTGAPGTGKWRKRSMPTQSKRFNPPTFEVKNGVETA